MPHNIILRAIIAEKEKDRVHVRSHDELLDGKGASKVWRKARIGQNTIINELVA
jgi:hypothetical protein